jgi:hypothetical protein
MVVLFLSVSCSQNYVEVRIRVSDAAAIDFEKYDDIVYADMIIESPPKDYNPNKELRTFFISDFSKIIEKDIRHFKDTGKTGDERLNAIKKSVKDASNPLLISGTLIFDIKSRSRIREVKSDEGKKEKKFVQVQHWELTLKIKLTELNTGKELFKKKYSEKLAEAEVSNPKYSFEDLFFKINNRFTKEITSEKMTKRRYLFIK